ncbi:hypothetical protein C8R42DRAFT_340358 [Lentinula raphanica]|nr:hypothetical protein C8R42DRAFT_340358 [Lentinula raphanica]
MAVLPTRQMIHEAAKRRVMRLSIALILGLISVAWAIPTPADNHSPGSPPSLPLYSRLMITISDPRSSVQTPPVQALSDQPGGRWQKFTSAVSTWPWKRYSARDSVERLMNDVKKADDRWLNMPLWVDGYTGSVGKGKKIVFSLWIRDRPESCPFECQPHKPCIGYVVSDGKGGYTKAEFLHISWPKEAQ